ncbi:hypothetical protein P3T76_004414 [Phytophthora citrophthora]|uniref:Uncharacterized protein n=1 Tax=Phytophthora citrophthora TaxID=4793 RepID=A0AAD9GTR7_9STRA|nr:hypothetical protein P3T76_004414 [Phytophthora citrophthora]
MRIYCVHEEGGGLHVDINEDKSEGSGHKQLKYLESAALFGKEETKEDDKEKWMTERDVLEGVSDLNDDKLPKISS